MLQIIAEFLVKYFSFFNVFKYITFRSGCALFTAFLIMLVFGNQFIQFLSSIQKNGQPIREDGPESHKITKKGTPGMGGIFIIFSILVSVLLWGNITNHYILLLTFILVSFGLIGGIDDYRKLKFNNSKGLSAKLKFSLQIILGAISVVIISKMSIDDHATTLVFPFLKNFALDLGAFYFIFTICVIVGASNAVNLTDGLDGLAIGPIIIISAFFAIISYLVGNVVFANYLKIIYVKNVGEIMVFCSALIGAGLGFLWYNAPPAKVFMGDTGSLALGAVIGAISVITKHELILFITGFVFVFEALSVILQVGSFKLRGKRIFKMAPIHHHFEKIGWSEPTIVIRFWILAIIFALIGLASLKLR
jgi:phospho-N-acetylmuramoyl-pentapeptide-transferase